MSKKSYEKFAERAKIDIKQSMTVIVNNAKFEMTRRTPEESTEISAIVTALMEDINSFFEPQNLKRIVDSAKQKLENNDIER